MNTTTTTATTEKREMDFYEVLVYERQLQKFRQHHKRKAINEVLTRFRILNAGFKEQIELDKKKIEVAPNVALKLTYASRVKAFQECNEQLEELLMQLIEEIE